MSRKSNSFLKLIINKRSIKFSIQPKFSSYVHHDAHTPTNYINRHHDSQINRLSVLSPPVETPVSSVFSFLWTRTGQEWLSSSFFRMQMLSTADVVDREPKRVRQAFTCLVWTNWRVSNRSDGRVRIRLIPSERDKRRLRPKTTRRIK